MVAARKGWSGARGRELRCWANPDLFLVCATGPLVRVVPRGERSIDQEKEGAPRSHARGTERPVAG
jgi:hypothetical protein